MAILSFVKCTFPWPNVQIRAQSLGHLRSFLRGKIEHPEKTKTSQITATCSHAAEQHGAMRTGHTFFTHLQRMFPPGLEPGTFRVLGERDNHYTTETGTEGSCQAAAHQV